MGTRLRVLRAVADRIARPSVHELGTFNPVHFFFVLTTIRLGGGARGGSINKEGELDLGIGRWAAAARERSPGIKILREENGKLCLQR